MSEKSNYVIKIYSTVAVNVTVLIYFQIKKHFGIIDINGVFFCNVVSLAYGYGVSTENYFGNYIICIVSFYCSRISRGVFALQSQRYHDIVVFTSEACNCAAENCCVFTLTAIYAISAVVFTWVYVCETFKTFGTMLSCICRTFNTHSAKVTEIGTF